MWTEYIRVIREAKPDWVVIENSYRLLIIPEWHGIQTDLENAGYEIGCFRIPASGVGAPHVRERAFVVAHTCGNRLQTIEGKPNGFGTAFARSSSICGVTVRKSTDPDMLSKCDSQTEPLRESRRLPQGPEFGRRDRSACPLPDWQENPPEICRMDDGFSRRVDKSRLQALGNAIVPRQVYPIFEAIARIERG
jgi:DNA (cytosine-5)-methyltransferase 1